MKVTFTVPGIPVGKGRPRFTKNGHHTYTPQKTQDYEDKVVQCWQCQSGKGFADGIPLRATVTAFFTVPRSTSKKSSTTSASPSRARKMMAHGSSSRRHGVLTLMAKRISSKKSCARMK